MQYQQTVKGLINLVGREAYGGCEVKVCINPAEPNTGIVFKLPKGIIPAKLEYINPTKFSTILENHEVRLLGPEHILATLYSYGIDNAEIKINRIPSKSLSFLRRLNLATDIEAVPYFPGLEKTVCDKIEEVGIEVQNKPRKILRLEEKIYTEKLKFEPINNDELRIKAITDYKEIGVQEREISLSPTNYKQISTARAYCKVFPDWLPEEFCRRVIGTIIFPRFGFYSGISSNNVFRRARSAEKWKARERMDSEIACHTIIDKLGVIALLDGRLSGVYITCEFSGHKNDLAILKKYKDKFKVQN